MVADESNKHMAFILWSAVTVLLQSLNQYVLRFILKQEMACNL